MGINNILTYAHITHAIAYVDECRSLLQEYLHQTIAIYVASTRVFLGVFVLGQGESMLDPKQGQPPFGLGPTHTRDSHPSAAT